MRSLAPERERISGTMQRRKGMLLRICAIILILQLLAVWTGHSTLPSARSHSGFVAAESCNCTQQAATIRGGNRTVNIAMLFWGPPADDLRFTSTNGSARIVWTRNPMLDGWNGPSTVEIRSLRAYQLWQERMELPSAYGGGPGLLMLDGSVMRFNLTWFNVGEFKWLKGPGEFTPLYQDSFANKIIKLVADPEGPYGRQHFVLTPLISNSQVTILASDACESSGTCLVVSSGAAESRIFICQDPLTQDCVQRGRSKGARRFENTVSTDSNTDYWASGSMSLVVNRGMKRIFAIGERWSGTAIVQMTATAKLLGMQVVGSLVIAPATTDWRDYNTSSAEITQRIKDLNVDMVVVLNTFEATTVFHDLLRFWRSVSFLPNAVAWLSVGASFLPADLAAYFLMEVQWLPTLTGAQFHAVSTDTSFEPFPANATHDSPAVFADAFVDRFGYRPSDVVFFDSTRAFHAVTIVQKLLELAQTEDMESLKQAAARIATPGVYHAIQFDQWGRSLPFDNYVLQLMADGEARVLTPLGLGSSPVLPIPSWSEREYKPVFLAKATDRLTFSLTALTVLFLLVWLVWLIRHWDHPLIRLSDPLFSALSLCGLIVLVSASFFSTFLQNDTTCAASAWLVDLGLVLGFAPLLLKNLRIWSLWTNSASFTPAPIRQWHMLCALFVLVLIEVCLLSAWYLETGMLAYRYRPDPYRPSLDYFKCEAIDHAKPFVLSAISWKALLLVLSMYLAYLLRNVSARFSESRFIALCVYNVTIVMAIFLPVTASSAAGNAGTYIVRSLLLIFLCGSTASIMLVPKFLAIRRSVPRPQDDTSHTHKTRAECSHLPNQMQQQQQQQPPQQPQASQQTNATQPQSHPPWHATIPGHIASAVHSPAPAAAVGQGQRSGVLPPIPQQTDSTMVLPFQSMIGLSQIGQRGISDGGGGGAVDSSQSQYPQASHSANPRRNQRRPPGLEMSSPAPLLETIPQSPAADDDDSSSPSSGSGAEEPVSPSMLFRATVALLSELQLGHLHQVHSSLLRHRRSVAASAAGSHSSSVSSGAAASAVTPFSLLSPSAVVVHASCDNGSQHGPTAAAASAAAAAAATSSTAAPSRAASVPVSLHAHPSFSSGSTVQTESFESDEQAIVSFYEE